MDWWNQIIQDGIVGAVLVFGIKEGFPIIKMIIQEFLSKTNTSGSCSTEMQREILRKLDHLIEHEIKNLSELTNNQSDLYRLLSDRGMQTSDILAILTRIDSTLQQISLDLRLQQELFRKEK